MGLGRKLNEYWLVCFKVKKFLSSKLIQSLGFTQFETLISDLVRYFSILNTDNIAKEDSNENWEHIEKL